MTSIHQLVRQDLAHREQESRRRYGAAPEAYTGSAAILDAYDTSLDLACYLRQIIEEMTIGGPQHPSPGEVPPYAS